jgi:hypothetical protein
MATKQPGRWHLAILLATALLAALLVFALLVPADIVDTDPQQCFSAFGYGVPCGNGISFVAAALAAVIVGLAFSRIGGSKGRDRSSEEM